jgi:FK506-binding protein 4/5
VELAITQYDYMVEQLQFEDNLKDESQKLEYSHLLLTAHLNLAACHLKLNNPAATKDSATKALQLDSMNEKALYRRGLVICVTFILVDYSSDEISMIAYHTSFH